MGIYGLQESSVVVTEGKRFMIIRTIRNYERKYNIDKKCCFDPNDCFYADDDDVSSARKVFNKMDCVCKTIAQEDFARATDYALKVVKECFKQREIYSIESFKEDKFTQEIYKLYTSKYLLNREKGYMSPVIIIKDILLGSGRDDDPYVRQRNRIHYNINLN